MDKTVSQVKWGYVLFSTWLTFSLCLLPYRQARAVIPVMAAVGLFLKTPLGKSVAASLAIHAAVLAVEFHNTASASIPANDTNKTLEVKLNPKDPMSTPAGWTAPVAPAVEPTPPATATGTVAQVWAHNYPSSAAATYPDIVSAYTAACAARGLGTRAWATGYQGYDLQNPATVGVGQSWTYACSNGVGWSGTRNANVTTCPAGYSGAGCTLANAAIVQKPSDNKAEISRVGNVLYVDARDTADGLPSNATVTSDTATVVDSFGNKWETKINADGTSTLTELKVRTDGSNKTDKLVTAFSAPNATTGAVEVTGAASSVFTGTGAAIAGAADAPTSGGGDAKDSTLQAIKASVDAGKAADLADRTAAETAAGGQGAALAGAAASGQDTVAGLGLPGQSTYSVAPTAGIGAALPANSGSCVALDVALPVLGNLHIAPCGVVTAVRPMIDFLVVSLGVLGGVFVLLGKREEE